MHTVRNKSERPRNPRDFYPTPYGLALATIKRVMKDSVYERDWGNDFEELNALDPGCGTGVWSKMLAKHAFELNAENQETVGTFISGVDIENHRDLVTTGVLNEFCLGDFTITDDRVNFHTYEKRRYDFIFGNPPFSLMEDFIKVGWNLLAPYGIMFYLCRLEFLASRKRQLSLYEKIPLNAIYTLTRRPSFFSTNGNKTTDAMDYAIFVWDKSEPDLREEPKMRWLYWDYIDEDYVNEDKK